MGGGSGFGAIGSPPRAWGRLLTRRRQVPGARITPTGVGTAGRPSPAGCSLADHPHGRGDGVMKRAEMLASFGSPPRAWGRHLPVCTDVVLDRITPTGVGTASHVRARVRSAPDHPHGRGDGIWIDSPGSPVTGSPPRAWGRRSSGQTADPRCRITPTGVGTAVTKNSQIDRSADHPHGRGDGRDVRPAPWDRSGSPPRAWGRHHQPTSSPIRTRITPTGVGTAHRPPWRSRQSPDHPHGRGDGNRLVLLDASAADHPHGRGDG